jgi:phosphoribosylanthranilate isomerase
MTRVKICGVTTVEDARLAAELGAVAIGLVFWPGSPRFVELKQAKAIVASLPPFVSAVGVFVDQIDEAVNVAREVGLSAVQFHGDEPPGSYRALPIRVIKAVTVRDASAREEAAAIPAHATVLLDAHDRVKRGGTGRVVDWSIAAMIARDRPVILSGGLNADNAADAVRAVAPYAIDVSSGVERAAGRKDPAKLRELFAALRAADHEDHEPRSTRNTQIHEPRSTRNTQIHEPRSTRHTQIHKPRNTRNTRDDR